MPTVIKQDGFLVRIYPNDHIPPHVHVIKGDGEVRIDLGRVDLDSGEQLIPPSIMSIEGGIRDKEVNKAMLLVEKNQAELLIKWSEIHDE